MSDKGPTARYQTIIVFGAPGSGKGTQGAILGRIPRFFHCACGDVFRALDTRTAIGQEFLKYSGEGKLVPDDVTVRLWKARIDSMVEGHQFKPDIDFLVLDGIPRNVGQAEIMEKYIHVAQVFHLTCPERKELGRRLKKRALKDNRLDDASDEVISKRLAVYDADSKPILEYYPADIITTVDATQPPAKVLLDILSRMMSLEVWDGNAEVAV